MIRMKSKDYGGRRVLTPLLLIGLTLFAGPVVEFVPDLMWHDRQRIGQIVLLLLTALSAASIGRQALFITFFNLSRPVRYSLSLGFALGGLSILLSALPRFASLEWATFLLLLGLMYLVASQAQHQKTQFDIWAMRVVVVVSVVIFLRTMMGYLAAMMEGLQLDTMTLFLTSFSNRRVFGQVASMAIPLLAYPVLKSETPRLQRWAVFALLCAWWMLVLASGTRGTWMALAVAAVFLILFAQRVSANWLKIQIIAMGAGAILFGILFMWLPAWIGLDTALENRLSNITHMSGREGLWAMAWTQIQAHPWLGIGPMQLAAIPMKWGAHPHNAILQLAAEWGIPAALALILPAMYGLIRLLSYLRQHSSPNLLLVCLTASLLAAGAQSMVDGVIVIPYTQIWLVFIAGWSLGVYFRDANKNFYIPDSQLTCYSRATCLVISGMLLIAFSLLLNGIYPEVLNRVEATQSYIEIGVRQGKQTLPPRYWAVGPIP